VEFGVIEEEYVDTTPHFTLQTPHSTLHINGGR